MNEESARERAPAETIHVVGYGVSDVGLERKNNEDAFHANEDYGLFVVCDGMGGHASGEIASRVAVDTMVDFVTQTVHQEGFRFPFSPPDVATHETRVLDSAVRLANRSVFAQSQSDPRHKGMGTTVVAVLAGPTHIGVVHVGDSRVYLMREGELEQITEDHSLLNHYRRTRPMTDEEIRNFKGKNVIVRAVGLRDAVQPEVQAVSVQPGDLLLLCTDGLSDLVDDDTIADVIRDAHDALEPAVDKLIQLALDAGGKDNVTVMLLRVDGGPPGPHVVRAPEEDDPEDNSPGFVAGDVDGMWDQETLPAYDLPQLVEAGAAVVVAPKLVDAPTPRDLPAVTPADIARAMASRGVSVDSKGKPIPPPPGGAGPETAPRIDLHAATPPAMPAARRSFTDTSPDLPASVRIEADAFDEQADTAPRQALVYGTEPEADDDEALDDDDGDVPAFDTTVEANVEFDIPDDDEDDDEREPEPGPDDDAEEEDFDESPTLKLPAVDLASVAARVADEAHAASEDEDVWADDDDDVWGDGASSIEALESAQTEPLGDEEPPRTAVDPAVAKMLQRSSVRRLAIPRSSRAPVEAERPFGRRDLTESGRVAGSPGGDVSGGAFDPMATVGAPVDGKPGTASPVTSRYEAVKTAVVEVDDGDAYDPDAWSAPIEAFGPVGEDDEER